MENLFLELSKDQFIVLIILASTLFVQFIYYFGIYFRVIFHRSKKQIQLSTEPVSIIICAKNEETNLKKFLPKVLEQEYPNFEVIVVNDCSEDGTEMLLAKLEQTHKNLRHTTIEVDNKFRHGKKLAITIGIKSAKSNILIFTDADCYPASKNWLHEIANSYSENTNIVLGYGKYIKAKGLLNRIVRFDTLLIGLQYLGLAIVGKPYMGVGRNLSYKKELFFNGSGFGKHYHILSGDDDLFINEHAKKKHTQVCCTKESITCSVAPTTFAEWFKQKRRHISSGKHYKFSDKVILGLEPISKLIFYIAIIYFLFTPFYIVGLGIYGFRLFVQMIIFKLGMNKLSEKGVLFLIPILDIFLPLFQITLIISNKITAKNGKWN